MKRYAYEFDTYFGVKITGLSGEEQIEFFTFSRIFLVISIDELFQPMQCSVCELSNLSFSRFLYRMNAINAIIANSYL